MTYRNNRELRLKYYRQYNAKRAEERKRLLQSKRQILEQIYGNVCSICGEKGFRLELHHKDFDGPEKRKALGHRAEIDKAIQEHDNSKYSILCHRCHDHFHRKLHRSNKERDREYHFAHREERLKKMRARRLILKAGRI